MMERKAKKMTKIKEAQPFAVAKSAYAMAAENDGKSGSIKLYGRVVEKRPIDYTLQEKDSGDYIVQQEFLEDLKNLEGCKEISISLNSVGGAVSVGLVIHNKLRDIAAKGAKITCTVDGVAMSAGSVIMCAADTVKAYPSSMVMVHKSSLAIWDMMNSDELRKAAETLDSYDRAIIAVYKRKTGKSEGELAELMGNETYMVGAEAKEKGFVDEVIEDGKGLSILASADKKSLIIGDHVLSLDGLACPSHIPVAEAVETPMDSVPECVSAGVENKEIATEGGNEMADEKKVPGEQEPQAAPAENRASEDEIRKAVLAERERISKIDAITAELARQFGADVVAGVVEDAKYNKPCTAEEMAYKAVLASAKKGADFLKDAEEDTANSNVNAVRPAAAPEDKSDASMTDAEMLAKAKAEAKKLLGGDE